MKVGIEMLSTTTPNGIEIRVLRGAVRLDTITVHYEADAELKSGFPTGVKE